MDLDTGEIVENNGKTPLLSSDSRGTLESMKSVRKPASKPRNKGIRKDDLNSAEDDDLDEDSLPNEHNSLSRSKKLSAVG